MEKVNREVAWLKQMSVGDCKRKTSGLASTLKQSLSVSVETSKLFRAYFEKTCCESVISKVSAQGDISVQE